jgi:hypothetical protein
MCYGNYLCFILYVKYPRAYLCVCHGGLPPPMKIFFRVEYTRSDPDRPQRNSNTDPHEFWYRPYQMLTPTVKKIFKILKFYKYKHNSKIINKLKTFNLGNSIPLLYKENLENLIIQAETINITSNN